MALLLTRRFAILGAASTIGLRLGGHARLVLAPSAPHTQERPVGGGRLIDHAALHISRADSGVHHVRHTQIASWERTTALGRREPTR
jgi:hypothetical protein